MDNRRNFTKRTIEAMEFDKTTKKEIYFGDSQVLNLYIRIGARSKTFYLYKRDRAKGYSDRTRIGSFPEMSVEQARILAMESSAKVMRGEQIDDEVAVVMLFKDFWNEFMEKYQKVYHTSGEQHYGGTYRRHMQRFYNRKVASITKKEVADWMHEKAKKIGKRTANECHEYMRAAFNWGMKEMPKVVKFNPCIGIKRFVIRQKIRFIEPGDEMKRFKDALDSHPNQDMADIFRICLFTGARSGNVKSMRWDQLNLQLKRWIVPDEYSKNKDTLVINLSKPALEVLRKRYAARKKGEIYVFPSTSKTGHIVFLQRAWKAVKKEAGITSLRIHDLRHTFASYMAMTGASLLMIAKALGHKSTRSTEIYSHLIPDSLSSSIERAHAAYDDASIILDMNSDLAMVVGQ